MNFFILTSEGKVITRPDSTRNKDNGDYFIPTDVDWLGYTPVIFARMIKTGKMIGREFAERYYDAIAFGILLYPALTVKNGQPHYCKATCGCFDKTSLMPLPMYNPVTLDKVDNVFSFKGGDNMLFNCDMRGMKDKVADAIVACSLHSTIHKGDLVLAELAEISTLRTRNEGDMHIAATFCSNEIIDIDLKF